MTDDTNVEMITLQLHSWDFQSRVQLDGLINYDCFLSLRECEFTQRARLQHDDSICQRERIARAETFVNVAIDVGPGQRQHNRGIRIQAVESRYR